MLNVKFSSSLGADARMMDRISKGKLCIYDLTRTQAWGGDGPEKGGKSKLSSTLGLVTSKEKKTA